MKRSIKKIVSFCLILTLLITMFPQIQSEALTYNGSASYKSGKYYTALKNVTLTGNQRKDIVNVAKSQIGYQEGGSSSQLSGTVRGNKNYTEYGRWYGTQDMWCAMFVSWCAARAGVSTSVVPKHAYTPSGLQWFKNKGRAYSRASVASGKYTPKAGDIIYFKSSRNKNITNHVGIVTSYSNGKVYTVEGNTSSATISTNGGAVAAKSYSISNTYIVYICSPAYTNKEVNTDDKTDNTKKKVDLGTNFYAKITGAKSGKSLSLYGNENVIIYQKSSSPAQVWRFVRQSDGSYKIINQKTGKYLDVQDGKSTSGTNVRICSSNNSSSQKWNIYSADGKYELVPACATGCALNVAGNATADSTNVNISKKASTTAQRFAITKVNYFSAVDPADVGTNFIATITASGANKNLSLSNTNVIIYPKSTAKAQKYKFVRQSDGSYKLINQKNNYVLTAADGKDANGTNVKIATSNNSKSQRWFIYLKEGKYVFRPACSDTRVLTVAGGKTADLTNVEISSLSTSSSQLFIINK